MGRRFFLSIGRQKVSLSVLLILCWAAFFLLRGISPSLTCIFGFLALFGTFVLLALLLTPTTFSSTLISPAPFPQRELSSLPPEQPVAPPRKQISLPLTAALVHKTMSNDDFEFLAAAVVMVIKGYQFERHCGGRGDQGVDVLLRNQYGHLIAVQAKRYATHRSIGSPQMREFGEGMRFYQATNGYFVTTSTFTKDALTIVQANGFLHHIDGSLLEGYLQEHSEMIEQTYVAIRQNGR